MEERKSLLSWLFKSQLEEDLQQEQDTPQPKEEEAPPIQQEADPFRLTLPPDHAVNRLSQLWQEQTGRRRRCSASRGRTRRM